MKVPQYAGIKIEVKLNSIHVPTFGKVHQIKHRNELEDGELLVNSELLGLFAFKPHYPALADLHRARYENWLAGEWGYRDIILTGKDNDGDDITVEITAIPSDYPSRMLDREIRKAMQTIEDTAQQRVTLGNLLLAA